MVAAGQARLGSIDAFGDQESACRSSSGTSSAARRTCAGGDASKSSPLSGEGLPIGGSSFLNFSTELRASVWRSLGAVIFLDGGNVWANPWDFNVNDMRYDVGPGLRYQTPIGPIRADIGYQLNPIPGLMVNGKEQARRFRFHFSIGQAF